MFALSIVHAVLWFLLIAGIVTAVGARRRINATTAKDINMKRASKMALGVLAAAPLAGLISFLLGTYTSRMFYALLDAPGIFWETLGTFSLAVGIPLVLFIVAREVIFALGGKRS